MKTLMKIAREPALVTGVATSAFGVAAVFGLHLTTEQIGAVVTLLGALMALTRFLTTPSAEVVAQVKDAGVVVAGPASSVETGTVVEPAVGPDGIGEFTVPVAVTS